MKTNLLLLREKRKMSQDELAKKLNVSGATISRWESNINSPNVNQLKKLSEILNCSVDFLIYSPWLNKNHFSKNEIIKLIQGYIHREKLRGDNAFNSKKIAKDPDTFNSEIEKHSYCKRLLLTILDDITPLLNDCLEITKG